MEPATFNGTLNVQLIGAANTAQLLTIFGLLGCPATAPLAPPRIERNRAILQTVSLKTPITAAFASPYEGSK
jgi:hypothetical protein